MPEAHDDLDIRIKTVLVERLFLDVQPEAIGSTESLTEAYGVDSVRLFDMIVGLEEDFDVSFADDELTVANFDTVEAILVRVREKMQAS